MAGTALQSLAAGIAALGDRIRLILAKWEKKKEDGYEEFEMPGGQPVGGEGMPEPVRPPLRAIDMYVRAECPCLSKRFTVAMLTCIGFIISFGMRCNMGMAKLQLENRDNATVAPGEFKIQWSTATMGAVDTAFFWGYLLTQIPGGFLASRFPANRIFGTAIATSAFLNLLVPGAVVVSPAYVVLVRAIQGFVEGVTYPACHGIWRFWAPPLERSRLATMAFSGSYAGIVIGMPLSALLTGQISWKASFYFYGMVGLIWYGFWMWLVFEKPCKHPIISAEELNYIETSLGSTTQVAMPTIKTTPFRAFFTSMPVYAIIVANFCRSWNFYLLVLYQASYLETTFKFKIEETGFIGALPHLLMTIIVPFGGMLADNLRKKGILSTTAVRKLFNCGGFGCEALFFLVVAHAKTAFAANLALTCGVALSGFAISGYNVNHLDIAPRYASILMGLSNGIGTIAGLICPIVIDIITRHHDKESWQVVFIMAATVHFIGVTFYGIFASGELQPWAEPTEEQIASWKEADNLRPAVVPPRPVPPGQEKQETSLSYGGDQGYGAMETTGANPFTNQWGDEQAAVNPSQLDLSRMGPGRVGNPFTTGTIVEEPVQPASTDYRPY